MAPKDDETDSEPEMGDTAVNTTEDAAAAGGSPRNGKLLGYFVAHLLSPTKNDL